MGFGATLLKCIEQNLHPINVITCRGIEKKRENPRSNQSMQYPLVYHLAGEFFDEYHRRNVKRSRWTVN